MKSIPTEIAQRLEKFKRAAKEAGLKLTHQRFEIFREVAQSEDHPSAEMVFKAIKQRMPTVSLDTVYRTLWLLTDLGLITPLGHRQDSLRFDANLNLHHHFVCVRCGIVRDFESDQLNDLPLPDSAKKFGRFISSQVEVKGICEQCMKEETGQNGPGTQAAGMAKE
jgi:Fur family transcriptional regulator, peroxide stress response regulator